MLVQDRMQVYEMAYVVLKLVRHINTLICVILPTMRIVTPLKTERRSMVQVSSELYRKRGRR